MVLAGLIGGEKAGKRNIYFGFRISDFGFVFIFK